MKVFSFGLIVVSTLSMYAMHEQAPLYYSDQVQKSVSGQELYKTDVKEFLKDMCLEYEKHSLEKEQWRAKLNCLNSLGCGWGKEAYQQAQEFRPFVIWHLKSERIKNLREALPLGKEERLAIAHACELFIEAAKHGRQCEWNWCFMCLCCLCNTDGQDWDKDTDRLIKPFEDLGILVRSSLGK